MQIQLSQNGLQDVEQEAPRAKIARVSNDGLVSIKFSKKMITEFPDSDLSALTGEPGTDGQPASLLEVLKERNMVRVEIQDGSTFEDSPFYDKRFDW